MRATGGYIGGTAPVTPDDDECVLDRDGQCVRTDERHYRESHEIAALSGWRRQVLGPCLHRHPVPVESVVDGRIVALLCPHCDEQLPA